MPTSSIDPRLVEKVLAGERITPADALALYHAPLEELGALANARRKQIKAADYDGRGNEIVTYIIDRNINYTNICNVYCKFCAFYRTERNADSYVISREAMDQKMQELADIGGVHALAKERNVLVSARSNLLQPLQLQAAQFVHGPIVGSAHAVAVGDAGL